MLPSYHRSSSTGVELEPLTGKAISALEGVPVKGNNAGKQCDTTISIESPSPSYYYGIRDLLVSWCIFMIGWWGPKYIRPSEEFLQNRQIPYQVLSNNDTVLDLTLDYPVVNPATVPCKSLLFGGSLFVVRYLFLHHKVRLYCDSLALQLHLGSIWMPIIVMSVMGLTSQRSYDEVIVGISSLLLGIGCSEGSTQLLKQWVLRRRPNFYQLCAFNMTTHHCEAEYHEVLEAQMSFPSGHSSLSWCGMIVLVWFLLRRRPSRGGKIHIFVCAVLPLAFATFVASSRIVDHWHHVSDVLTGVLIGCLSGTIGFHVHHSTPSGGADVLPTNVSSSCLGTSKLPSSHE